MLVKVLLYASLVKRNTQRISNFFGSCFELLLCQKLLHRIWSDFIISRVLIQGKEKEYLRVRKNVVR